MTMKNDTIYRIISILSFIIHSCVFAFVTAVGFLPYNEDGNFYQAFSGYFGAVLRSLHPIFMLLILLSACVCSYFAIKRPQLSLGVALFTFVFFLLEVLPFSFEAAFVSFLSQVGEISMSTYQIGFRLISGAAYIIYFDFAFVIYSFITLFIRGKNSC